MKEIVFSVLEGSTDIFLVYSVIELYFTYQINFDVNLMVSSALVTGSIHKKPIKM